MNDTDVIPPTGVVPRTDDSIDVSKRKAYIESVLQSVKDAKPDWFVYSDLLSERPIDGFIRQLDVRLLDKSIQEKDMYNKQQNSQQRLYQQNQGVKGPESQWERDPNTVGTGRVM